MSSGRRHRGQALAGAGTWARACRRLLLIGGGLACLPALAALPAPDDASNQATFTEAHQNVLSKARRSLKEASTEDRKAARRLLRAGDRAYQAGEYARASTAYANAYPNAPLAEAYVMAGDAHWRAVLQARSGMGQAAACPLGNRYFRRDLALDLAQHQQVGLALAGPALRATWWYLRARRSTDCLQQVADRAAQQPPEACADLAGVRACLGPSLPPR
ncbi:MAG: hypothetical protein ACOZE7_18275 [Pseudomonadota bacterium]